MKSLKETELGMLPESWEVVRLGEVCDFYMGRTPPRKEAKSWNEKYFPWVSISDMQDYGFINFTKEYISKYALEKYFKNRISKAGTLLMSFKLTIGRTSILNIDAVHNEAIVSIYTKNSLDKMFLFFYLPTIKYEGYMNKAVKGNTLNLAKISTLSIPLPPIPEQRKIASILSTVQKTIETENKLIERIKELKKTMMHKLFTEGTQGEKQKMTEIGPIPESWEVVNIIDYCDFERGTEPGSKFYNRIGEGVPFIRVGNISAQLQELVFTTSENIKICNEDDILISLDGSPGIVAKGIKGAYASGIRKVILKTKNLEKNFIYYVLQTSFVQKTIEKYSSGVTIKHASKSLPHIKIPLPPLSEQQKIANILSTIDQKIQYHTTKKQKLEELFRTMLNELMTGKIRVV